MSKAALSQSHSSGIPERVAALDGQALRKDLDERGYSVIHGLLDEEECRGTAAFYEQEALFRSTIVMSRHAFGQGEYRYFKDPLPPLVQDLRACAYEPLAAIADGWNEALDRPLRYPKTHEAFRALCREAGQTRPTPLLLRYREDDYNCLHRDLYGELAFPLQLAILLSRPGEDFEGGEFVLVEQRPRQQSRAEVVPLRQGDGVVFAVNERPVRGTRGVYRTAMRHGVSRVRKGERFTLGVIFHDAA